MSIPTLDLWKRWSDSICLFASKKIDAFEVIARKLKVTLRNWGDVCLLEHERVANLTYAQNTQNQVSSWCVLQETGHII